MSRKGNGCGADLEKAGRAGKVKFWIAYRLPGGKQKFEKLTGDMATSIDYARDADTNRKARKRENRNLDNKPEATMTFQELTDWYLGLERVQSMAYFPTLKIYLRKFNSEFGNAIASQITAADLKNLQVKRKADGKADSTVDQEIAAARAVINKGFNNDLVGGDALKAFKKIKKLVKRRSNSRAMILTPQQFRALLDASPPHLLAILNTAFYTGMRRGEILNLTWSKVDLKNRVICLDTRATKDPEAGTVPICKELFDILKIIPKSAHDDHVFLYKGKPIKDIRTGLKKACKDACISYGRKKKGGFVFHDLRHCFNSYMRKAGVSEPVITGIAGHAPHATFDRYKKIDEEDINHAVNLMKAFLSRVD